MNDDLVSRSEAREHIYKRLYETALNNTFVEVKDASNIFTDIADKRLNTWVQEIKPADNVVSIEKIDKMIDEIVEKSDNHFVPTDNDGWLAVPYIETGTLFEIIKKYTGRGNE